MQAHPTFDASASPSRSTTPSAGRLVTDAPTRMFHWLFALSFLGAYLTADGERWRLMHVTLGYTLAGLLVFRLLYGLFGPRQAGLGLLWRKLASAPAWLASLRTGMQQGTLAGVNGRQAQNLLMALAVITLMAMVVPLTLSGYATYNDWGDVLGGDWLGEIHEFFGEAFLVVVLAHLALIVGLSVWRGKNQALPMLTGRVQGSGPNLVQKNRRSLAALLLLAVLAFGAWQWQQSPGGLIPSTAWSVGGDGGRDRHGDDDD